MKKLCKLFLFLAALGVLGAAVYALGVHTGRRRKDEYITLYDAGVEY